MVDTGTPTPAPDAAVVPAAAPAATAPPAAAPAPPPASSSDATAQAAPYVAQAQAAYQQAAKDAAPTPPPKPVPHARLLAMISGLATGLSAAGTAIATRGKEGGAQEVLAARGEQQRQQIEAQQAAVAQKNAKIQQDLMVGDTATKLSQTVMLLHSINTEMTKSDLEIEQAKTGIEAGKLATIGQAQDIRTKALQDFIMTGDKVAFDDTLKKIGDTTGGPTTSAPAATSGAAPAGGVAPSGASPAVGVAPASAASQIPPVAMASWQNSVDSASNAYPNDPQIQQYAATLKDAAASPMQMAQAANAAKNRMSALDTAVESRTKQEAAEANSPVAKLATPEALAAPGAAAAIQAKIADPTTDPNDVSRLQALIPRAQLAQKNALLFEAAKERQQEAITNGDPKAAGALLQSGLVSPQELISSRKPEFAQAAFDEAIRLGGGTKGPDGKWTGGTWSAVKAEAQYEYAKNPQTQNTLNLLTTMQAPGGSIDIAQRTFNAIPGKIDENTFNKITTGAITEFGGKSTAAFRAAMVSLADEYAQVLQGGAATQTTLGQAHDLIQQAYSKNAGAAAFDTIRQDMAARQKGLVRDNPALVSMYPPPPAAKGTSGMSVSLAAARQLPAMKGKTDDEIKAAIQAQGHTVAP